MLWEVCAVEALPTAIFDGSWKQVGASAKDDFESRPPSVHGPDLNHFSNPPLGAVRLQREHLKRLDFILVILWPLSSSAFLTCDALILVGLSVFSAASSKDALHALTIWR